MHAHTYKGPPPHRHTLHTYTLKVLKADYPSWVFHTVDYVGLESELD